VLYAAMALTLAVALWGMKKNMLRIMLGSQLVLPVNVWHNLAIAWMGYCLFMAALNACMVLYFSTDQWMNFKLWGFVFPLVFLTTQGVYIARYLKDRSDSSSSQP
jgi:intracellular septation protein